MTDQENQLNSPESSFDFVAATFTERALHERKPTAVGLSVWTWCRRH